MKKRISVMFLLLGVSLICLPTNANALLTLNPENGHYYEAISGRIKWTDANTAANGLSYLGYTGHLATVTSANEDAWIFSTFNSPVEYWLGGTDRVTEGQWKWVTGEPWGYTNWNGGEPNNLFNEDYLAYWNNQGKWNDWKNNGDPGFLWIIPANRAEGYIVEYDVPRTPEPASMLLLGSGLLGLVGLRNKKKGVE